MKVTSAEFITSATSKTGYPKLKFPEIAILGRSNVGKSSIINSVLSKRGLAKTSSTPGKTRLINYFLINQSFYLVDLPGYGYAKVSKSEQETWKKFIEAYLTENQHLKLLLQLIDIRHEFKDSDRNMIEFLNYFNIPYVIILTKADKLNQSEVKSQTNYFKQLNPGIEVITSSAEKGLGKEIILRAMEKYLNEPEPVVEKSVEVIDEYIDED